MQKIIDYFKQYFGVISIVLALCILLTYSLSYFKVNIDNKRAAEMYIGELKYTIEIEGDNTNTLTVPNGETVINVKVNNLNPVDTYYKLLYLKNSNITIKYYESTKDTNEVITSYNKPNDLITNSNSNIVKLLITNSSSSSQNVTLTMNGGYITNTLEDVTTPSTHSEITLVETPSKNTYFCKTNDALTQGLEYVDGQYTYGYKKEGKYSSSGLAWTNISTNGWGVQLTDKESTDPVTSKLCTYINNKPIVDMSYMFYRSSATTLDLSSFNTNNVINMDSMFRSAKAKTIDLSSFDTSNVTDMKSMFSYSQATTLDVSNFDTSNVTNMRAMFMESKATTIKGLNNFDTSKVTDMGSMFSYSQATTLDLSSFNTSKVTDMGSMFLYSAATTINLSSFDTSKVTNMGMMFSNCQATSLDLSNFNTSKVTNMGIMFSNCKATSLDLSNFNTSNVTNMSSMFYGSQATTLDLSSFNTSNVTNMSSMFYGSQATSLDLSSFNTSNVTNMDSMFRSAKAKRIDVSNFNTSNVNNMSFMFMDSKATTLDLSSFNTSNVTNMSYMFYVSNNLKTIYASSKFVTTNVTSSTDMFFKSTNIVGGAGTKYNSSYVDKTYAHIDGGTSNPGYFTDIADKPKEPESFATDSWKTIINAVKNNNISKYNVGDTKTVDMGTYGTHTLRIANTSTPSECSRAGFSQSACGFVLEFADIITTHKMNDTATNVGGWPATSMRTFVNNNIYNAIPSEIKNAIIDTTVVSGHGKSDTENFTSTDKLYFLAPGEVFTDWNTNGISSYDTAKDLTRTLDYYTSIGVTINNKSGAIKSGKFWWFRAAYFSSTVSFYIVSSSGNNSFDSATDTYGVAPAFRIG